MRLLKSALLALVLVLLCAPAAFADGTPDITLDKSAPERVLFGETSEVTLTASNPGPPNTIEGYNLTFRDVLPAGTSYVAGSADVEPRILANAPLPGQTTLLFENVSDLSPNSEYALTYEVAHSTTQLAVGDSYTNSAEVFVNTNPRFVPRFTITGTPIAASYTGFADDSATTQLTALEIEKSEPSPEGELLRGVHDHQTVYTLTLRNNAVNPTDSIVVDDYLPAGLEFLGCGTTNNTTDAPTNPGSDEEYPGSGPINPGNAPGAPDCVEPSLVETVSIDPDGAGGPLPLGVYTHVRWTGAVDTLAPGATDQIQYVAAIPIRENTTTWSGGSAPPTGGAQGSNLDNNSGPETSDEQALTNLARASGEYNGTLAVFDEHTLTRTAEDLAVHKSVIPDDIDQGQISEWTLDIETSEYRYVDNIRVTDTLPDGLCPLGATNLETTPPAASAECNPVAGELPSAAYTSATEQANGTWILEWDETTVPELGRMQPSSNFVITFPTRTRAAYQENFQDERPILTRDSWTNHVSILGADFVRCAPDDPDCTGGGTRIDADEADGTDDADESSASQEAGGVTIDKRVRQPLPTPVDCATGTYVDGPPPLYGPGDRVCWILRVDFASLLDSGNPVVTDFLPPGTVYEAGSATRTANDTLPDTTFDASDPQVLLWNLGSTVDSGAKVFEWRFSTIVSKDASTASGDIPGNLMKFHFENSEGETFPLRDQADFERTEATLDLVKGVRDVDGVPAAGNPANTDNIEVQGGSVVTYRVDVSNTGDRDAGNAQVWDDLPLGIACSDIVMGSISNGGTCDPVNSRIQWSGLAVAAGGSATLTYDLLVPTDISPGQVLDNEAGVRSYTSATNLGGQFTYFPANNIDPAVTDTNATAADDVSRVFTQAIGRTKARTTEHTSPGNNTPSEATIGEEIDYTVTISIPQGTTLYGSPVLADALGTRQTYVPGSASGTLNGAPLPTGGVSVSESGNTVRVNFPATYTNPAGSGDDTLVLNFSAQVADVAANTRTGSSIPNSATLTWQDQDGGPHSEATNTINTAISEPLISLSKDENDADDVVEPGQILTYTVRPANGTGTRVSTAYDLVAVDTIPGGLTPVNGGVPVADGGTVGPQNGVWNAAARTITWNIASLAPGTNTPLVYDAQVDDPALVASTFTNNATLSATSLPDPLDNEGERTTYSANATDTVRLGDASVTKNVDPGTATIGDELTYTVDLLLPAGIRFFDATVIDNLPDGIDFDAVQSATCLDPCNPGITVTQLPAEPQPDGSTRLGWFLGDLDPGVGDRTVRIVYTAHVDNQREPEGTPVEAGQTYQNSVAGYFNRTDKLGTPTTIPPSNGFDDVTDPDTATVTIEEPHLTIDKGVSGDPDNNDERTTQPGDSYTYTVAVHNDGDAPAYDVDVSDVPAPQLQNVVLTDGSQFATDTWSAADPDIHWVIPGPIAPGDTVLLRYTASLVPSAQLSQGETVVNTAVIDRWWGVPEAERNANPGVDYREYLERPSDTVTQIVELPQIEVDKEPAAGPNAEIGQPFGWRVVIRNASTVATAHDVDVSDELPPNWEYIANSASFAPGGPAEPTITDQAGGDMLAWDNVGDLGPGEQIVLTFDARPLLASATNPGSGAGNPHVNDASANGLDSSGAGASEDGPYADTDSANAILQMPALTIEKTPDDGSADAGSVVNFEIQVQNTGTGTARNVRVTDVLPATATYTPGTATADPGAGFSEESVSPAPGGGQTIVWEIDQLAPSGSVTITLPVRLSADLADGTNVVNNAGVVSDELPDPVDDDGDVTVTTSADVSIDKVAQQANATAGEELDYVLRVTNAGPSDAQQVAVTDTLPANVSFVSAEAPCTFDAPTRVVTCQLGTLAPGTRELDLTVEVLSSATGNVVNPASVTTTTDDPNPDNNDDEETTPIGTSADLAIEKSAGSDPFIQGDEITFELEVTNNGPSDAANAVVTDALPAGLSYVSASTDRGSCSETPPGTVRCELGNMANGATASIDVVVSADDAGTFTNTAVVGSDTTDDVPENDEDDAEVTVLPAADLAVTKTGDATVDPNGQVTYTLTATNNGPSPATGVSIADTLPAGTSFVESDPAGECTAAGGEVTCPVGDLAVGASDEFTIRVAVPFSLGGAVLTNIAEVSGNEADTDPSNDTDEANTTVGPAADLELTKTAGAAVRGGEVAFTLVINNRGPSTATGVQVNDPLPAGLSLRSATPSQGSCSDAGGSVSCALGSMAAGASAQVTILAGVSPELAAGTTITNSAAVTGNEPDPEPEDNDDTATTTVVEPPPAGPSLVLEKSASQAQARLGVPFTYVINVRNEGTGPATGVRVTDTLSRAVRFVSVRPSQGRCNRSGRAVSCSLGELGGGASAQVRLRVVPLRVGPLRNVASVVADGGGVSPGRGRDDANVRVRAPRATLALDKRADRRRVEGGELVRYGIVARVGSRAVANLRICDVLPDGLVFVRARGATFRNGRACWTRDYAGPRSTIRLSFVARAERGFQPRRVTNVAVARASNLAARRARAPVMILPAFGGAGGGVTG